MDHAWTTSWGVSTRLIGAIIMTHSDNDGLILPPRIAPVKVAILPISSDEAKLADKLEPMADKLSKELNTALGALCTKVDRQYHMRPGDRFFHHLQKGVPLRIEIGEREAEEGVVTIVRRDTGKKETVPVDAACARVQALLTEIQNSLYDKAKKFREDNTFDVSSLDELKAFFGKDGKAGKDGFARAYFAGSPEDEKDIKDVTGGATIRVFPQDDESTGKCVYTGKEGARRAVFAKAY